MFGGLGRLLQPQLMGQPQHMQHGARAGFFPPAPEMVHGPHGQQPQQPGGLGGMFGNALSRFQDLAQNNPEALIALGSGMMQGNMGAGFASAGEQMGKARERHAEQQRRNQTAEFMRRQSPEYGAMIDAGFEPKDVFALYGAERKAQMSGRETDEYGFPTSGAISQKLRAYKLQGFDDDQALGLATGRYQVSLNPMTGERVLIDVATQQIMPLHQPPIQSPDDPNAPDGIPAETIAPGSRPLADMVDKGTGFSSSLATGATNTLGQLPGPLGDMFTFPDEVEAAQSFELFKRDLIRSLALNPRFPVAEQQRIENLVPRGALTSPATLRTSLRVLDQELARIEQEAERGAADPRAPIDQRQADMQTVRSVRAARQRLGVPGVSSGAEASQDDPLGLR